MRQSLSGTTLILCATLAACSASKDAPPDSAMAAPAPAMAAAPALSDFAGTWEVTSKLAGVEKPVPSTLMSTPDGATWTMTLEGRPNVPVTASMVGDSLVVQSSEYESVLRKGVMVSVRTASVLSNGMMMGNMVATYKTPKGEEVVAGTTSGMRKP